MKLKKTRAYVTNTNPRKEGSGDEMALASDISLQMVVDRKVLDDLVGSRSSFSEQFFNKDKTDCRLLEVTPIRYEREIEDIAAHLHIGNAKPMKFEPARIKPGSTWDPQPGGYMEVSLKLQVHPTATQSGKLDESVKEWIEVEIMPMTEDGIGKD